MTLLRPARRRPAALLAVAASGALLSGCSFFAPSTAIQPYAPSDGLQAELGDVLVRNMLVVSEGDGEPGVLVGALVNRGQEDTTVGLELPGLQTDVDLPAGVSVVLGSGEDRPDGEISSLTSQTVELDEVEGPAGSSVELVVTAASGSTLLDVPVILPTGPYEGLVPTGGSGSEPGGASDEPSDEVSSGAPDVDEPSAPADQG